MNLTTALNINPSEIIALVGGGGKTTTMFKLGQELAKQGKRVLLTTTTRIFAAQIKLAPYHLEFNPHVQNVENLLINLETALEQHNQILLIGAVAHTGKAFGVDPKIIDALAQSNLFDIIINEADGSRMRSFKAPADHEPVIPTTTTLVIPTIGLDILSKPLTEQYVHRPTLVSQLSQTPLNTTISPQTIATVLGHQAGGLKNIPPSARVIPLLNKLDLVKKKTAQTVANLILQTDRIDSVVIGAVAQPQPVNWVENRVAAIILAAGQSTRFGSPKQLALWQNKTLLEHAVDTALASKANPVIVVLGANASQCQPLLKNKAVQTIINPNWAAGQSTSMQTGLAALPHNISAALFLLADQPLITPAIINTIITHYQQTLAPIVWPTYNGKRGNPVLFNKHLFPEMHKITGDIGAKPILLKHKDKAQQIEFSTGGILKDVDTEVDLAHLKAVNQATANSVKGRILGG